MVDFRWRDDLRIANYFEYYIANCIFTSAYQIVIAKKQPMQSKAQKQSNIQQSKETQRIKSKHNIFNFEISFQTKDDLLIIISESIEKLQVRLICVWYLQMQPVWGREPRDLSQMLRLHETQVLHTTYRHIASIIFTTVNCKTMIFSNLHVRNIVLSKKFQNMSERCVS